MDEIGPGLVEGRDRVIAGQLAAPEAGELGEDEPDPVARLAALSELLERARVGTLLRGQEAIQVMCHEGRYPHWVLTKGLTNGRSVTDTIS
ncbi:MAG: hypothetical protein QOC97_225 [Chloroflexota bacterium]|nr:hypothetical protein [Chloroflexota bacterium]